jgi:hypothetical protein
MSKLGEILSKLPIVKHVKQDVRDEVEANTKVAVRTGAQELETIVPAVMDLLAGDEVELVVGLQLRRKQK